MKKVSLFSPLRPLLLFALALLASSLSYADALYQTVFKIHQTDTSDQLDKSTDADGQFEQWVTFLGFHSDQFRLQNVKESLTATHYHYQQYEQGLPVDKGNIAISVSKQDGSLIKSHAHIVNTQVFRKTTNTFEKSRNEALNIAWTNIRVSGKLQGEPSIEQVWLPTKNGLVAAYRVTLSVSEPLGDWVQYIDAKDGRVIKMEQIAIFEKSTPSQQEYKPSHFWHIDTAAITPLPEALDKQQRLRADSALTESALVAGKGRVFDPDPKTTLNDDTLTDGTAPEQFETAYFIYDLPEVTLTDGVYSLRSPWVEINDFDTPSVAPATTTDGNWLFTRGQGGFDDTNVFYHLDANQRYIQSLGFKEETGIQYGMIRADANGAGGADNSYYSPTTNSVSFGHGGVNDSEDADVVLHEYAHAIHFSINENWGGPDAGGIGEGFGDYWAGSYSLNTDNGNTFFPNRVFTWDGHNEFWPGRILNDLDARYNPARSYPAHATIDGVLSDQLWSTPLFQSLLQLIEMGYSREEVDTIVLEAQFGLGGGITMPMMAESTVQAASRLYPQGPHAGVFLKNFITHNILDSGLTVDAIAVWAGGDNTIEPGELAFVRIPLTSKGVAASNVFGQITLPDTFLPVWPISPYHNIEPSQTAENCISYIFWVPHDTACGTKFDIDFSYQASIKGLQLTDTKTFKMIVGSVETASALQDTPLSIPDNGPEVLSSLVVDEPDTLVSNVKVRVNIEHTYIGDLLVGIESPQGTRILLHAQSGGGQDNLQVTYPDDAAPARSLSDLDGEPLSGEWKFFIQDRANLDVGQVVEWELIYQKKPVCD